MEKEIDSMESSYRGQDQTSQGRQYSTSLKGLIQNQIDLKKDICQDIRANIERGREKEREKHYVIMLLKNSMDTFIYRSERVWHNIL